MPAELPIIIKHAVALGESLAKRMGVAKGKEILKRWSPLEQLLRGTAADHWVVVEILRRTAVEVARAVFDRPNLPADEALQLLLYNVASDATMRRRMRAFWREASVSSEERVAMLAVGFLVGAEPTPLRERLDWAVLSLFPDDADALGTIIEHKERLQPGHSSMAIELIDARNAWVLVPSRRGEVTQLDGPALSPNSVRALAAVQCIELGNSGERGINVMGPPGGVQRTQAIDVLPLGYELHGVLSTVDWREIARRRSAR